MSEKAITEPVEHALESPRTKRLLDVGQSTWLDYISACMIQNGEMQQLVENQVITGMTSNPTIFAKAIGGGECGYKEAIRSLHDSGKPTFDIYDEITRRDIASAADVLLPVFEQTRGLDGYVSLEASPELAYEEDETVHEVLRLYRALNRLNVMIKVPATDEGITALRRLISEGININVTLIFSPRVYERVAYAYVEGLREFAAHGGDVSRVASVASFFVSRVDTAIDKKLDAMKAAGRISEEMWQRMRGQAAVANARLVYREFQRIFHGSGFDDLLRQGGRPQRVLWASTSTKDPAYPDLKYVEALIGPETVDTMPQETLEAFLDHGEIDPKALTTGLNEAEEQMRLLEEVGIDFEECCADLLKQGLESFSRSFQELLSTIRTAE